MLTPTRFSRFIAGVVAFKKVAYATRVMLQRGEIVPKVITEPQYRKHIDAAKAEIPAQAETGSIATAKSREATGFLPYGKAAPQVGVDSVNDYLATKGHKTKEYENFRREKATSGEKDHLMSILKNTHYFFGARLSKDKQAMVSKDHTGLDDDQITEINKIDHGLNNSQLHALLYLDSHDILKDAPLVVSDRYQQSRYFDMMREEIKNKQEVSGKPMLDAQGHHLKDRKTGDLLFNPIFVLDKKSLGGIHARVRKSLLPELAGDAGDVYTSDRKAGERKETTAQVAERHPPVRRGLIRGAAKFSGLAVNRQADGEAGAWKPEGKDGTYTDAQLLEIDKEFNHSGGYNPNVNANFTRMWHAVMHEEVWGLIDGTDLGKTKTGADYSQSEKRALYHSKGARGVIEALAETRKKEAGGDKDTLAKIEDDRMRAMVAIGLTFATDHVAQALVSEGEAKTSSGVGGTSGFLVLPSGEWLPYANEKAKNALVKKHNATQDSGALWYDDDMAQTDSNLIKLLNHLNIDSVGWKPIPELDSTVPPTDAGGEQHIMLTNFKSIIAPTSYGMQPGANLRVAVKMYTQALKEKKADKGSKKSVFAYISTKQDESTDPDAVLHIQHENRLYGRAKALSNSMEILAPELYANITELYKDSTNKPFIKKAIYLQKEWLRLNEDGSNNRDIIYRVGEKPQLKPKEKKPKDGEEEPPEKKKMLAMYIRHCDEDTDTLAKIILAAKDPTFVIPSKIREDDLDLTVKGALKRPSLTALARNHKHGDSLQKINKWADAAETKSSDKTWTPAQVKQLRKNLTDFAFTTEDLQKDWTTRGGSINPMLRFIKNYSGAFGEHGDKQLAAFLTGSHSPKFMAQEWAKYALHTDENGRNSYQVEMQEAVKTKNTALIEEIHSDYADLLDKSEKRFIQAAPAGLRQSIKDGKLGVSGAYIFGPKGGNFHQDLSYQGGYPTKDLWYTRWMLWGLGTMTNKKGGLIEAPPKELAHVFDLVNHFVAAEFKLSNKQVQAIGWYHWKNFCTRMGVRTAGMENYTSASKKIYEEVSRKQADMPSINRKGAAKHAKDNPLGGTRVPDNISKAAVAAAYAVDGYGNSNLNKAPTRVGRTHGKPHKRAKGKGSERLPGRNGGRLKFAQFMNNGGGGLQAPPVAQRTNIPFGNAVAKSGSGKNIAHAQLGDQLGVKAGVRTKSSTAIGDWPDGSEQSTVHYAPKETTPAILDYLGAWHGLAGQKKSVLVFHPSPDGPDSMYHIEHPETDLDKLRKDLNQAGLYYKTLVPGDNGTKVLVFDHKRATRPSMEQYATKNKLNVEENTGQGKIIGHNGSWNSEGALPKARQAFRSIIDAHEQNSTQTGTGANSGGPPAARSSTGGREAIPAQQFRKTGKRFRLDKTRRILEGFLRQHNSPNKELPPTHALLAPDLQSLREEHLDKYQSLIPGANWQEIQGAVGSLQSDPEKFADLTCESNRREMYCKEHARAVLHSSGLAKMLDSLVVNGAIPEHAQHLIVDAKDGDYFALDALSAELQHAVPAIKAMAKSAEREYNKAGRTWDKMRSGPQKYAREKQHHSVGQPRGGPHGTIHRGSAYGPGQFSPSKRLLQVAWKNSPASAYGTGAGKKPPEDSIQYSKNKKAGNNITNSIKHLRGG